MARLTGRLDFAAVVLALRFAAAGLPPDLTKRMGGAGSLLPETV